MSEYAWYYHSKEDADKAIFSLVQGIDNQEEYNSQFLHSQNIADELQYVLDSLDLIAKGGTVSSEEAVKLRPYTHSDYIRQESMNLAVSQLIDVHLGKLKIMLEMHPHFALGLWHKDKASDNEYHQAVEDMIKRAQAEEQRCMQFMTSLGPSEVENFKKLTGAQKQETLEALQEMHDGRCQDVEILHRGMLNGVDSLSRQEQARLWFVNFDDGQKTLSQQDIFACLYHVELRFQEHSKRTLLAVIKELEALLVKEAAEQEQWARNASLAELQSRAELHIHAIAQEQKFIDRLDIYLGHLEKGEDVSYPHASKWTQEELDPQEQAERDIAEHEMWIAKNKERMKIVMLELSRRQSAGVLALQEDGPTKHDNHASKESA